MSERLDDPEYKEILRNARVEYAGMTDSQLFEHRESLWYAAVEYIECSDHIVLIDAEIIRRKIAKMQIEEVNK
jgi:hypothetical protein